MSDFKMTSDQKGLFDKLKPLQREIALNSLSGMNDIDSYKASSGKAKTEESMRVCANQVLTNINVIAFLDSMKAAAVSDAVMTREEAMTILSRNARVKVSDIATFSYIEVGKDEDDNPILETVWKMKDSDEIDPDVMHCIKSVTMTKQGPKIELHDQQAAIKQLSTMQGWGAASKLDLTSLGKSMAPKDPSELTDEELAKIIGD